MEEKNKKMFTIFMLLIIFFNFFSFLKMYLKKKGGSPDIVQTQRSIGGKRNVFISGLAATPSTVTASIKNIFKE